MRKARALGGSLSKKRKVRENNEDISKKRKKESTTDSEKRILSFVQPTGPTSPVTTIPEEKESQSLWWSHWRAFKVAMPSLGGNLLRGVS